MTAKTNVLDPLLSRAILNGASDLLLVPGVTPRILVRGHVQPVAEAEPISNSTLDTILDEVFGTSRWTAFGIDAARGIRLGLDARLTHEGETFRVSVKADENLRLVANFRLIASLSGLTESVDSTNAQIEAATASGPLGAGKISSLETIPLHELLTGKP
ncbi:MAG TPA: hypothetical protein VF885_00670 [Arthrobacter sp.]